MGSYHSNHITLIDFGLSFKKDKYTRHSKSFTGTPLYASNDRLLMKPVSQKDDLESLAYILIYFRLGFVPWPRMDEAPNKTMQSKMKL
jgi:serine/threonine protein kinase